MTRILMTIDPVKSPLTSQNWRIEHHNYSTLHHGLQKFQIFNFFDSEFLDSEFKPQEKLQKIFVSKETG